MIEKQDENKVLQLKPRKKQFLVFAVSLELGEQTFTTLKSLQGREMLKQNILSAVQKIMQEEVGRPGIENVLFTRYTLQ